MAHNHVKKLVKIRESQSARKIPGSKMNTTAMLSENFLDNAASQEQRRENPHHTVSDRKSIVFSSKRIEIDDDKNSKEKLNEQQITSNTQFESSYVRKYTEFGRTMERYRETSMKDTYDSIPKLGSSIAVDNSILLPNKSKPNTSKNGILKNSSIDLENKIFLNKDSSKHKHHISVANDQLNEFPSILSSAQQLPEVSRNSPDHQNPITSHSSIKNGLHFIFSLRFNF